MACRTTDAFSFFVFFAVFSFGYSKKTSPYEDDPRPICLTDMDFSNIRDRVVGGSNADKDSFRFVAGLLTVVGSTGQIRTDMAMCGATVITDRHVLTASHCLYGKEYMMDSMRLNIGDYDTLDENETKNIIVDIEEIRLHPKYDDPTFNNDIAILKTKQVIPLGKDLRAVILPPPNKELSAGTMCTVWGWGRTSYKGSRATVLQQVDVPITTREECQKQLTHEINNNMICAGGIEGKDACLGDSGGTLLVRAENYNVACGIVSFGRNCALPKVSGVYTNLALYVDWVLEQTRDASCKPRIIPEENYPH